MYPLLTDKSGPTAHLHTQHQHAITRDSHTSAQNTYTYGVPCLCMYHTYGVGLPERLINASSLWNLLKATLATLENESIIGGGKNTAFEKEPLSIQLDSPCKHHCRCYKYSYFADKKIKTQQ